MDFLGAVNRVLVNAFIIKGDDDLLTNFNDNQHEGSLRIAKQAIQTELNYFNSVFSTSYERAPTVGQITIVAGTRAYALPSDFVRFWGDDPYLYQSTDPQDRVYEYPGGENHLRKHNAEYKTDQGSIEWWYWEQATTKQIAMYNVPDSEEDGNIYQFDYERDVSVSNSTDTIPFQNEAESEAFADMASRRFTYMIDKDLDLANLEDDREYQTAQSTLMNFMTPRNASRNYAKRYR